MLGTHAPSQADEGQSTGVPTIELEALIDGILEDGDDTLYAGCDLKEHRGQNLACARDGSLEDKDRCWGGMLKGDNGDSCTPGFTCGKAHFKVEAIDVEQLSFSLEEEEAGDAQRKTLAPRRFHRYTLLWSLERL